MKTYLILTEDKNRQKIKDILASKLDGFTLFYGEGYWISPGAEARTYKENSLAIMILTNEGKVVKDIAREIKKVNNQESVMVISWKTEMEMI